MKKEVICIGCIDCGEYVMVLHVVYDPPRHPTEPIPRIHALRCPACSKKWLEEGNTLVKKPMGDLE